MIETIGGDALASDARRAYLPRCGACRFASYAIDNHDPAHMIMTQAEQTRGQTPTARCDNHERQRTTHKYIRPLTASPRLDLSDARIAEVLPLGADDHETEERERLFAEAMMRMGDRQLPGYCD